MKKYYLLVLALVYIFDFSLLCQEKEKFYDEISRTVIHLEHVNSAINVSETKPDGTAFFCARGDKLFIVTARHVAEKNYDLQARVNVKNIITNEIEVILLKLSKDRWIFHNDDGDIETHYVDVAAQRIPWIKDRNIKQFRYGISESEIEAFKKNLFAEEDPLPPQSILSFGFPVNIGYELYEKRPFGRQGIVAMVAGEKFMKFKNGKYANSKNIILDLNIFSGNSGSPVMNNKGKPFLFGLIIATNTKYNFAVMEPISRIKEVLDITKEQSIENIDSWFFN